MIDIPENSNYHDEEYDGVVLKIPSFFIKLNGLEPQFKEFCDALKSANKSVYLPDHVRNIYELENYEAKKEQLSIKKKEEGIRKEKEQLKYNQLLKGEIYELVWKNKSTRFVDNSIRLPDKVSYSVDEILTHTDVKSSFKKLFYDQVKDFNSLKELSFLNPSNPQLTFDMTGSIPDFFKTDSLSLFNSKAGHDWTLGLSYQRLYIKYDWKKNGFNYQYLEGILSVLSDDTFVINTDLDNLDRGIKLEGFKRNGLYLVK